MKYSDAILLGSTWKPQAYGWTRSADGATCANGAALDAMGKLGEGERRNYNNEELAKLFPVIVGKCFVCPRCGCSMGILPNVVAHLNDYHTWTREAIAEWVAKVERDTTPALTPIPTLIEDLPPVGVAA